MSLTYCNNPYFLYAVKYSDCDNPTFRANLNSFDGFNLISQLFYKFCVILLGDNNVLAAFEIAHFNYE